MSQSTGTIITVAPTGTEHATGPTGLIGIAQDCERVGAGMIAVPGRLEPNRVAETVRALREQTNLVVRLTAGDSAQKESDRLRVLDAKPDCVSCGLGDRWEFVARLYGETRDRGIVPVFEITELGQFDVLRRIFDELGPPAGGRGQIELIMGRPGGMPGDTETLVAAARQVPAGATFSATGVDRSTLPVMLASLSAGGHVRVGLADTADYAPNQPAKDNVQLVARVAGLARIAQRPPVGGFQVRELLGVKGEKGLADVAV